jgi:hypothetical protein
MFGPEDASIIKQSGKLGRGVNADRRQVKVVCGALQEVALTQKLDLPEFRPHPHYRINKYARRRYD